jgi:hypothetical protein
MRRLLYLFGSIAVLFIGMAVAGINWKAVWLEPKTPVVLTVGESQPYTVMGLDGMETTANLTKSSYLKITSSDPGTLEVDRINAMFVGRKPGKAEIRISFSEATANVQAVVNEPKGGPMPSKEPAGPQ